MNPEGPWPHWLPKSPKSHILNEVVCWMECCSINSWTGWSASICCCVVRTVTWLPMWSKMAGVYLDGMPSRMCWTENRHVPDCLWYIRKPYVFQWKYGITETYICIIYNALQTPPKRFNILCSMGYTSCQRYGITTTKWHLHEFDRYLLFLVVSSIAERSTVDYIDPLRNQIEWQNTVSIGWGPLRLMRRGSHLKWSLPSRNCFDAFM